MFRYISYKTLIFVPIFWLSYLFQVDASAAMIFRIISFVLCFLLSGLVATNIMRRPQVLSYGTIESKSITQNTLSKIKMSNYIKSLFANYWISICSLVELISAIDPLRIATVVLIVTGCYIGNPIFNKYKGVKNYNDSDKGYEVSGDLHILISNKTYRRLDNEGYFDQFESFSTGSFIFKEAGISSGYYPRKYKYFDFFNMIKLIIFPLFEAIIKALLIVPIYYILFIYIHRTKTHKI